MNIFEKLFVLAVLILYVQAEDGEVPKVSVKHFYTVEAKMDVVQNVAIKYFNSAILEKLVNKDLEIASTGGVTAKDLEEKIEEAIINYNYRKLALKISNAIKTLPIELIHPLMTKVLPNGVCNSKISQTQAIMQFFDFIMVKVVEAEIFFLKCYELKEFLTGANLKKKKQYVRTSIDQNIQFFYSKMMSHIENFVVPDVPTDFDGPIDGCILDLECNYSGAQCNFKNVNLQHEWSPITITTDQTTKTNDQISHIQFESSPCTLNYIPNAIFKIFLNSKFALDVSRSSLARLEPEFFLNANNLIKCRSYQSNITVLKALTFIHAPNLILIDLDGNQIEYIDHQAFEGLSKLTTLDLQKNNLKALSVEIFRPMLKLNNLYLQENSCINKHFTTSSALTTLQTELEVNTKCSQNDDIHQISKKLAKTEEAIEKRLRRIESLNSFNKTPIEERFKKLEGKLDEMMKMIEKIVAPIQGPIEHNN